MKNSNKLKLFLINYDKKQWENIYIYGRIILNTKNIQGGEDYIEPYVGYDIEHVHYNVRDYSRSYLTFIALEDGTFSFKKNGTGEDIQYSLDDGKTWTSLESEVNSPIVKARNKILFKAELTPVTSTAESDDPNAGIGTFNSTCRFNVEGNVMSLLFGDDFSDKVDLTGYSYAFYILFVMCKNIISAENLILPATILSDNCYRSMFNESSMITPPELPATTLADNCYALMFQECTNLIAAPELLATTLAYQCYRQMFQGCTSLTIAHALPATTLTERCYYRMFYGCTALKTAPELPTTTLATECYVGMFYGCTSLEIAPELPATTLANTCYALMFQGCTSLEIAPELPATTLATQCYYSMFLGCTALTTAPSILPTETLTDSCYYRMFYGCTNLNYIKCLATDVSASNCTFGWVYNVASGGTFVKDVRMQDWAVGFSGIPSGWTIQDAA